VIPISIKLYIFVNGLKGDSTWNNCSKLIILILGQVNAVVTSSALLSSWLELEASKLNLVFGMLISFPQLSKMVDLTVLRTFTFHTKQIK
jgi:hypothetical protein